MAAVSLSPSSLQIGWAHGTIMPDKPVQLHGQFHERVSQYVNDPLTATALAISSDAGEQAILVSVDAANLSQAQVQAIRRRVGGLIPGFNPRKLWVNATHTHTCPTMMEGMYPPPGQGVGKPSEYASLVEHRVSELAAAAWAALRPAAISSALGHAVLGFNRRTAYHDGTAVMYGSSDNNRFAAMEGGMDPGVEILCTWDGDERLTGVVVNLACPAQVVEGQYFISADYWHPARQELRRRLGPDVQVLAQCSAAGDQSPRDLVRRNRGEPGMREIAGMNELGRRLALAVADALEHAQTPRSRAVAFTHLTEELSLPKRKVTALEVERAREQIAELSKAGDAAGSKNWRQLRRHQELLQRYQTQGDDPRYVADLHVLRLGDVALASNPFELFLDYGLQIKARSRALQTLVVQLTNDRGLYLPTARAVAGGSYSAMISDNLVGPEGGQLLVERTVEMINSLWPAQAS